VALKVGGDQSNSRRGQLFVELQRDFRPEVEPLDAPWASANLLERLFRTEHQLLQWKVLQDKDSLFQLCTFVLSQESEAARDALARLNRTANAWTALTAAAKPLSRHQRDFENNNSTKVYAALAAVLESRFEIVRRGEVQPSAVLVHPDAERDEGSWYLRLRPSALGVVQDAIDRMQQQDDDDVDGDDSDDEESAGAPLRTGDRFVRRDLLEEVVASDFVCQFRVRFAVPSVYHRMEREAEVLAGTHEAVTLQDCLDAHRARIEAVLRHNNQPFDGISAEFGPGGKILALYCAMSESDAQQRSRLEKLAAVARAAQSSDDFCRFIINRTAAFYKQLRQEVPGAGKVQLFDVYSYITPDFAQQLSDGVEMLLAETPRRAAPSGAGIGIGGGLLGVFGEYVATIASRTLNDQDFLDRMYNELAKQYSVTLAEFQAVVRAAHDEEAQLYARQQQLQQQLAGDGSLTAEEYGVQLRMHQQELQRMRMQHVERIQRAKTDQEARDERIRQAFQAKKAELEQRIHRAVGLVAYAFASLYAPRSDGGFHVVTGKPSDTAVHNGTYLFLRVADSLPYNISLGDYRSRLGSSKASVLAALQSGQLEPFLTLYCHAWDWGSQDRSPKKAFAPASLIRFDGPHGEIINDRDQYVLHEAAYPSSSAALFGPGFGSDSDSGAALSSVTTTTRRVMLAELADSIEDQVFVQHPDGFFDEMVRSVRRESAAKQGSRKRSGGGGGGGGGDAEADGVESDGKESYVSALPVRLANAVMEDVPADGQCERGFVGKAVSIDRRNVMAGNIVYKESSISTMEMGQYSTRQGFRGGQATFYYLLSKLGAGGKDSLPARNGRLESIYKADRPTWRYSIVRTSALCAAHLRTTGEAASVRHQQALAESAARLEVDLSRFFFFQGYSRNANVLLPTADDEHRQGSRPFSRLGVVFVPADVHNAASLNARNYALDERGVLCFETPASHNSGTYIVYDPMSNVVPPAAAGPGGPATKRARLAPAQQQPPYRYAVFVHVQVLAQPFVDGRPLQCYEPWMLPKTMSFTSAHSWDNPLFASRATRDLVASIQMRNRSAEFKDHFYTVAKYDSSHVLDKDMLLAGPDAVRKSFALRENARDTVRRTWQEAAGAELSLARWQYERNEQAYPSVSNGGDLVALRDRTTPFHELPKFFISAEYVTDLAECTAAIRQVAASSSAPVAASRYAIDAWRGRVFGKVPQPAPDRAASVAWVVHARAGTLQATQHQPKIEPYDAFAGYWAGQDGIDTAQLSLYALMLSGDYMLGKRNTALPYALPPRGMVEFLFTKVLSASGHAAVVGTSSGLQDLASMEFDPVRFESCGSSLCCKASVESACLQLHRQIADMKRKIATLLMQYKAHSDKTELRDKAQRLIVRVLELQNRINQMNGMEFKEVDATIAATIAKAIVGLAVADAHGA
jgi:hypothetical protein